MYLGRTNGRTDGRVPKVTPHREGGPIMYPKGAILSPLSLPGAGFFEHPRGGGGGSTRPTGITFQKLDRFS